MRRRQAFKRGRVLSIVIAGFAGYVVGGWNGSVPRSPALSAAQSVALRFPQDLGDASPVTVAFATSASATSANATSANAAVTGNTRLALFSPQPLAAAAPQAPAQQASAAQLPTPQAPLQMASADQAMPQPAPAAKRPNGIKPVAAAAH